jgi:uncharacterized protein
MFLNREKEIARIGGALKNIRPQLIVVYGRRRCGKSTLLQHLMPDNAIYFSADLRDAPLQRDALAREIEPHILGFSRAVYPDWESLFLNLNTGLKERTVLCIDEFPYLVKNSPELPSLLQKLIDNDKKSNYHLILCGSSQQMMHSMVLDKSSPLYGRSDEIVRVKPMSISNLQEFLSLSAVKAIEEYGVWGGVPRYWEIRARAGSFEEAVKKNVLDQHGLFYEEPERLFADEMRTSVQAFSLLSLIGSGAHRMSEIAGRMQKPATHISGLLSFLTKQGYIKRDIPFGESPKTSKKSLYRIEDPFMNFYFTFLLPNKSRLEYDMVDQVWLEIRERYDQYISFVWEDLCRKTIPQFIIAKKTFNPASRWWGAGKDKKPLEVDIVASSTDNSSLLIGEVKWTERPHLQTLMASVDNKIAALPFTENKTIVKALFLKHKQTEPTPGFHVFTPEDVIGT